MSGVRITRCRVVSGMLGLNRGHMCKEADFLEEINSNLAP